MRINTNAKCHSIFLQDIDFAKLDLDLGVLHMEQYLHSANFSYIPDPSTTTGTNLDLTLVLGIEAVAEDETITATSLSDMVSYAFVEDQAALDSSSEKPTGFGGLTIAEIINLPMYKDEFDDLLEAGNKLHLKLSAVATAVPSLASISVVYTYSGI